MATNLLQKTAQVAVGIPVSAAKGLLERARELREEMHKSGERIGDDLKKEFDRWVTEGEHLIERISELRDEGMERVVDLRDRTEKRAEETVAKTRESMEKTGDKAVETVRAATKAVTAPRIPVEEISGIGPATAKKLAKAGITTVPGFLERTQTNEEIELLAEQTAIPVVQLTGWRKKADLTRVKGIGEEFQTLLQAARIGTIEDLAAVSVEEMERKLAHLGSLGFDQVPSITTAKDWIAQAKKLV